MCNLIIRKHAPNGGAYYEITDQYSKSSKVMKGKGKTQELLEIRGDLVGVTTNCNRSCNSSYLILST